MALALVNATSKSGQDIKSLQPSFMVAMHRQVCRQGLRVASTEGERSILWGLLAGATWWAGRAAGHAPRGPAGPGPWMRPPPSPPPPPRVLKDSGAEPATNRCP